MIKSMTAFSRADKTQDNLTVCVEIRSYNSRYLDTNLKVPQAYLGLEEKIKSLISEKISRGRVEVKMQIQDVSEEACAFEVDKIKAAGYHQALVQLKEQFGITQSIALENLTHISGLIRPADVQKDMDACWPVIQMCMNESLDDLEIMRSKEGAFLADDFKQRLDYIETAIGDIEAASEGLLAIYQTRLKDRIAALTRGMVEIDPARIAQESAFLADRSDISEEIVRAKSHIKQFREMMKADEPAGRKLNFLLQEFNREFNTMGSKTSNAEVSHVVVALKTELEKIREQVQNVE